MQPKTKMFTIKTVSYGKFKDVLIRQEKWRTKGYLLGQHFSIMHIARECLLKVSTSADLWRYFPYSEEERGKSNLLKQNFWKAIKKNAALFSGKVEKNQSKIER